MRYPELDRLHTGSTLADLPSHHVRVTPATMGQVVADEFERRPELPGIIVAEDDAGRELGVISRTSFFQQMSRQFSLEIYRRRPVSVLLQALPETLLRLGSDCPIPEAARLALNRPARTAYEPIVVSSPDGSTGVLDVHLLLLAQSALLSLANVTIQRQAGEAEAANRAKSTFLAAMSHELRTPLNGILGMTELTLDTEVTREQREFLGVVRDSADILLTLVNDILDFSKIEAGKLDLDPSPFDLRDHLSDALKPLALRAHTKGLELACHILADVPDNLVGDVLRLRQIIINLVNNAVKFTAEGEVVVRVTRATEDQVPTRTIDEHGLPPLPGELEGVFLHFVVNDTGIGIPADKCLSIFDPFVQADGTMTRKFGGTGLGLAICKKLVAMMGGEIWVTSEPGVGSQFHFTCRLGLTGSPVTHPIPPAAQSLHDMAVLVVDDNATSRQILTEMLVSWRMRPQTVASAAAALTALKQAAAHGAPFPLLLLDARMPVTDGFALAEQLRDQPGCVGAILMMLSSGDPSGEGARCRKLGLSAHLNKPFRPSDLLDGIVSILAVTPQVATRPTLTPPPEAAVTSRSLKILLAEDNPINQTRALRLLEKLGHKVGLAMTGKEALEALDRDTFDVVLMDVQMPEMDGLEATGIIRNREKGTGKHQPIIALTAHALKGDRERCLEAGADGYVTKPFRQAELLAAMAEALTSALNEAHEPAAPSEVGIDPAAALASVDGDRDLLAELVKIFEEEGPRQLETLRKAINMRDLPNIVLHAHALKGGLGTLGAASASQAALVLEQIGRSGDLSSSQDALAALEHEFDKLRPALAALLLQVATG